MAKRQIVPLNLTRLLPNLPETCDCKAPTTKASQGNTGVKKHVLQSK